MTVVFDTETTGVDPAHDELVEIAGVSSSGRTFQTYINPGRDIPCQAKAVHHITEAMVADAPGPAEALDMFFSFFSTELGGHLCAHNAKFDFGFLAKHGRTMALQRLCTMKAARAAWPEAPGYSNQVLRYWRNLDPKVPEGLAPTAPSTTRSPPRPSSTTWREASSPYRR